jgi:hypothetical protein
VTDDGIDYNADDNFECDGCGRTFDIEDSIRVDKDTLICPLCNLSPKYVDEAYVGDPRAEQESTYRGMV